MSIKVGSTAFFTNIEGFKPKDNDILVLVNRPNGFDTYRRTNLDGVCIFEWKRMSPKEFIKATIDSGLPMNAGKFLVKEFVDEIGFTIDDLKELECMFDSMDYEHLYEKVIYDAYIENNDFYLTDKQLHNAYAFYKATRINNVK